MRTWRPVLLLAAVLATAPRDATAQQAAKPYTLEDVLTLLQGGFSGTRILSTIGEQCISFRVADAEQQLLGAGGDSALIAGLRNVCYRAAAEPASTRNTPQRGYVHIIGDLPPGWTRKVNELPETTNRDIDMTPGRRNVVTVKAPGYCPYSIEISVEAGENRNLTPILRPRPWIGPCPEPIGGAE